MKTLTVRMKADDTAEILLYDVIGGGFWHEGITAKQFREAIKGVKAKTLNLRVNSPGGDVFEAAAMVAALDDFRAKGRRVEVDVDGLAASAASYVIMSSEEVRVGTNAMVMIHNPHAGVLGGSDDMRAMADLLDKVRDQIIDSYERKSKAGREQLAAWMKAESWFTGQEAVEAGLADKVTEPVQVAALARHSNMLARLKYKNAPAVPEDSAAWEATRTRQAVAAKLFPKVAE